MVYLHLVILFCFSSVKKNKDRLHELVTEKAYPVCNLPPFELHSYFPYSYLTTYESRKQVITHDRLYRPFFKTKMIFNNHACCKNAWKRFMINLFSFLFSPRSTSSDKVISFSRWLWNFRWGIPHNSSDIFLHEDITLSHTVSQSLKHHPKSRNKYI